MLSIITECIKIRYNDNIYNIYIYYTVLIEYQTVILEFLLMPHCSYEMYHIILCECKYAN